MGNIWGILLIIANIWLANAITIGESFSGFALVVGVTAAILSMVALYFEKK